MGINRYIIVKAIKLKDNTLIPIWDSRIVFEKTEMYGNVINIKGDYNNYSPIDCIYDIKKKVLSFGIELDYYPEQGKTRFALEDDVYFEVKHDLWGEGKIKEIVYTDFDLTIIKGSDIDECYKNHFKDVVFDKKCLYALKFWKPYYRLYNGILIEWEHRLHKKYVG